MGLLSDLGQRNIPQEHETSVGQHKQDIQGYPPQDAKEHPTNTNNIKVPSPNRPRSDTSVRLYDTRERCAYIGAALAMRSRPLGP
eukprot:8219858-Pyramimonas_sp.AAC.1